MSESLELTPVQQVIEHYETGRKFWTGYHDSVDELIRFFDGYHFEVEDDQQYEKDRRDLHVIGQETSNVVRHKHSAFSIMPLHFDAEPVEQGSTPDDEEQAVAILEGVLYAKQRGFRRALNKAALGAMIARYGVLWLDYYVNGSGRGDFVFRAKHPRRIMWEPPFESPHDPQCGWLIEERWMTLRDIRSRKKWKHAEDVIPDDGVSRTARSGGGEKDGVIGEPGQMPGDAGATILFCWYRNHPEYVTKAKPGSDREMEPGDRYLSCVDCGQRSPRQQDLAMLGNAHPYDGLADEMGEWPEMAPKGCPHCAGDMDRMEAEWDEETTLANPGGNWLVITARHSGADEPLYEGDWPVPKARTFPCAVIECYAHPTKPFGSSDVLLNLTSQVASDVVATSAVQRTLEFRNYYVLPADGLLDAKKRRFEFRDDQFNVMYRDDRYAKSSVDVINGTGLDPATPTIYNILQDKLLGKQGIADFGLKPGESEAWSGTAIQQATQQAELPLEEFAQRAFDALGHLVDVTWDYVRDLWQPARPLRVSGGDEGAMVVKVDGGSLPDMEFTVAAGPNFTGLDEQRSRGMDAVIRVSREAPEWLEEYAAANKIPMSIVRRVRRKIEQQKAAAAAAGGGPGVGPAAPEAGAEPMPGEGPSSDVDALLEQMGMTQGEAP